MIRWLQVFSVLAAVGAAIFVFQVKYRAEHVAEHVAELQRQVDSTNESVSALKAEWSYLIQPDRVQDLVGRHSAQLNLVPLDTRQITTFDKLPFRPAGPKPEDEAALSAILERPEGVAR
jgi:hypothetical protein